jgi:hypothetical protein
VELIEQLLCIVQPGAMQDPGWGTSQPEPTLDRNDSQNSTAPGQTSKVPNASLAPIPKSKPLILAQKVVVS